MARVPGRHEPPRSARPHRSRWPVALWVAAALVALAPRARAEATVALHEVSVRLAPDERRVEVEHVVHVQGEGELRLSHGLQATVVESLTPDVVEVVHHGRSRSVTVTARGPGRVRVRLETTFAPLRGDAEELMRSLHAYVGPEGAFLHGGAGWYSGARDDHAPVRVTITGPYDGLVEGKRESRAADGAQVTSTWTNARPFEPLTLVAGPWKVVDREHHGTALHAYFHEDDLSLAPAYLDAVARYLDEDSARFGPYPFESFAVVEHFLPTGYGFATFTLLGESVVRLPFIIATSLRHEVAHCWWGNGVLVGEGGNWCEALTTFVSDYQASLEQGPAKARDHRWDLLADYAAYTRHAPDLALADFRGRHDNTTRAVGYAKGTLLFHELRRRIGPKAFEQALRALVRERVGQPTTWADLRAAFEAASGQDLAWFFAERVERKGAPSLALEGAHHTDGRELALALRTTDGEAWRVLLPVEVTGADGATWTRDVDVSLPAGEAASVRLPLPAGAAPARVRVDPNFDVVRRLSAAELPVSLRRVMGAARKRVVLPDPADPLAPAYRAFAPDLAARLGATLVEAADATLDDGVVVLGSTGPLARALAERLAAQGVRAGPDGPLAVPGAEVANEGACLVACAQVDRGGVAGLIVARSPAALQAALKLVHYGREGRVLFDQGRAVGRGRADPAGDGPLSRKVE